MRIVSFGYLHHGEPPPAHITVDLRQMFRDPNIDPAMREMTGLDWAVRRSVLRQTGARGFAESMAQVLRGLWNVEGATLALGCAGGRHRSVVLAQEINRRLIQAGVNGLVSVEHRDIDKPVVRRGDQNQEHAS